MKPDLLIRKISQLIDMNGTGKQLEPLLVKLSEDSRKEGYVSGFSDGIDKLEKLASCDPVKMINLGKGDL